MLARCFIFFQGERILTFGDDGLDLGINVCSSMFNILITIQCSVCICWSINLCEATRNSQV